MLRFPKCSFCRYRIDDNDIKEKCRAYPDGIPEGVKLRDEKTVCRDSYSFENAEPGAGEEKADGLLSKLLGRIGE